DGFDGLRRLRGFAERQQAEGAVLIDGAVLLDPHAAGAQAIERRQRVLVGRRRVQITRGRERILGNDGRRPDHDGGRKEDAGPRAASMVNHFFLMSTLSLAGVVSVTVTTWSFSPNSGFLNTISCVP